MRSFFTNLLAATIVVAGCQSIELSPSVTDIDNCTSSLSASTKVTPTHLAAYINGYKGIPKTRSADVSIDPILNGTDTVMYLVNYPEGGWEVLSADLRVPKVLVMCKGGSMTIEELVSNPAEEDLYGAMGDYISYLHDNPDLEVTDSLGNWSDVAHQTENMQTREIESWVLIGTTVLEDIVEEQDHLTETKWGQGCYYSSNTWNISAPYRNSNKLPGQRCIMGCVPVAAAQMLYYLHYKIGIPDKIYASSVTEAYIPAGSSSVKLYPQDVTNSNYTNYVWGAMPKEGSSSVTQSEYRYVSSLMLYLGSLMNATYTSSLGTSASKSCIPSAFRNLGIYCINDEVCSFTTIYDEVVEKKIPVVLSVYYMEDNKRQGHSIVVDGCYDRFRRVQRNYVWNSISGPKYKTEIDIENTTMIAINWGYDGDGMYSVGSTIWYDYSITNWAAGGHVFTNRDLITYGFSAM